MNKLKGYVVYNKNQPQILTEFLNQAEACEYTPIVAIEPEFVSLINPNFVFNLDKARAFLGYAPSVQEIAMTLSHIQCWEAISANDEIANNEFVIVANADIALIKHYYSALQEHVNDFLFHSKYQIILLSRSQKDDYWDMQTYVNLRKLTQTDRKSVV